MKPIIFSAPMVRALLAGAKTQTRRVVKPRRDMKGMDLEFDRAFVSCGILAGNRPNPLWVPYKHHDDTWYDEAFIRHWPQHEPGDECWVKEPLEATRSDLGQTPLARYQSDGQIVSNGRGIQNVLLWRWKRDTLPSMFFPRLASRISLRITFVRCERLQDITDDGAIAEGADFMPHIYDEGDSPRDVFRAYWDTLHGERMTCAKEAEHWLDYGWKANPWVWVYGLEVM